MKLFSAICLLAAIASGQSTAAELETARELVAAQKQEPADLRECPVTTQDDNGDDIEIGESK